LTLCCLTILLYNQFTPLPFCVQFIILPFYHSAPKGLNLNLFFVTHLSEVRTLAPFNHYFLINHSFAILSCRSVSLPSQVNINIIQVFLDLSRQPDHNNGSANAPEAPWARDDDVRAVPLRVGPSLLQHQPAADGQPVHPSALDSWGDHVPDVRLRLLRERGCVAAIYGCYNH
jgi:hypothetical protein